MLGIGIVGKSFKGKFRTLAGDMQDGSTVLFDDTKDGKKLLAESWAKPGMAVGSDGAGAALYVRPQRGAQERRKIELMTTVWAILRELLSQHPQWWTACLRPTGPGGCLSFRMPTPWIGRQCWKTCSTAFGHIVPTTRYFSVGVPTSMSSRLSSWQW